MANAEDNVVTINPENLPETRETTSALISYICYKETDLRDEIAEKGVTREIADKIHSKLETVYQGLGLKCPDLSWIYEVNFKIHKNTDNSMTIPSASR